MRGTEKERVPKAEKCNIFDMFKIDHLPYPLYD
jgi:hypothetical protein